MLNDAKEAANYYKDVFNGEITYVMYGKDMPECPEEHLEDVMHLQLKFNGSEIFMADNKTPSSDFIQIHLNYPDLDEMKKVFEKLSKGNTVVEELKEEFWGAVFGRIKDKYGVTWQLHYTLPQE